MENNNSFFFLKDLYPFHYPILCRYDAMLRTYNATISVVDTDHENNSLRWTIETDKVIISDNQKVVASIAKAFYEEFYSTCELCGEHFSVDFSGVSDYYYGCFPDKKITCDYCSILKNVRDVRDLILAYRSLKKKDNQDLSRRIGSIRVKFEKNNTVDYCMVEDLSLRNGYQIVRGSSFFGKEIRVIGYYLGFTDVKGIPVLSTSAATYWDKNLKNIINTDRPMYELINQSILWVYGDSFGPDSVSSNWQEQLKEAEELIRKMNQH